ncbi:MAG: helix-turn-helix domain-containing protein [Flavonifractor plautii]
MTQEAAAERLGDPGQPIRAYETGQRIPPPEVVDLMVIAYDSQLLGIQHLRASADMARSIVPDIREVRLPEAIMDC